jgi:hypothetical protein
MALFVLRCGERDRFHSAFKELVRVSRLTDHTIGWLSFGQYLKHSTRVATYARFAASGLQTVRDMLGSTAISAARHTGNMLRLAAEQIVHAACTSSVAAASATRVFIDSMNASLQNADEQRVCSCVTQCVLCQSKNLTTLWRKGTNGPVFYHSLKKA